MSGSKSIKQIVKKFPNSPGVYLMKDKSRKIIYIGKAISLKNRVGSYFTKALDNKTAKLVSEVKNVDYQKTDTVIEALILESNLINKYKPKYNVKLKDDKSFVNIIITSEEYPRVLITRPTDKKKRKTGYVFGPYASKQEAAKVINLLIKIFDVSASGFSHSENLARRYYIKGYSSGKVGDMPKKDYGKIIKNIRLFLEGRKKKIIQKLESEMKKEAKKMNFEKAAKIRNQVFALEHIQDAAFIKGEDVLVKSYVRYPKRAEAYDISNMSGKLAVGSMVVFFLGKPDKNEYRRFKIKTVEGANDTAMLKEVLERRLKRKEWKIPDLIIIDGGLGQKNIAQIVLRR